MWGQWHQLLPSSSTLSRMCPKSGLAVLSPSHTQRQTPGRQSIHGWAASITMRIQWVSLRELDLQSGRSQHNQSDNLELPQTGFPSLCTTGRLSFLSVTTPPLMHFQLQVKFITRLWVLGLRSRPEKERALFWHHRSTQSRNGLQEKAGCRVHLGKQVKSHFRLWDVCWHSWKIFYSQNPFWS